MAPSRPRDVPDIVYSRLDGRALNSTRLQHARAFRMGCAFTIAGRDGNHSVIIPLHLLPFNLRSGDNNDMGSAHRINATLRHSPTSVAIHANCVLPSDVQANAFLGLASHHQELWSYIQSAFARSTAYDNRQITKTLSPEVRELRYETLGDTSFSTLSQPPLASSGQSPIGAGPTTSANQLPPVAITADGPDFPDWDTLAWLLFDNGGNATAWGDAGDYYGLLSEATAASDAEQSDPFAIPDIQPVPSDTTHTPCYGNALVNNPDVRAILNQIWQQSDYDPSNPSAAHEVGGWLIQQPGGGSITFQAFAHALGACGFSDGVSETIPPNVIATVHTHPFAHGDSMYGCGPAAVVNGTAVSIGGQILYPTYNNTPSDDDYTTSQTLASQGVPNVGYIVDQNGIYEYSADAAGNRAQQLPLGRCGY
jgi:hypothetical protein